MLRRWKVKLIRASPIQNLICNRCVARDADLQHPQLLFNVCNLLRAKCDAFGWTNIVRQFLFHLELLERLACRIDGLLGVWSDKLAGHLLGHTLGHRTNLFLRLCWRSWQFKRERGFALGSFGAPPQKPTNPHLPILYIHHHGVEVVGKRDFAAAPHAFFWLESFQQKIIIFTLGEIFTLANCIKFIRAKLVDQVAFTNQSGVLEITNTRPLAATDKVLHKRQILFLRGFVLLAFDLDDGWRRGLQVFVIFRRSRYKIIECTNVV